MIGSIRQVSMQIVRWSLQSFSLNLFNNQLSGDGLNFFGGDSILDVALNWQIILVFFVLFHGQGVSLVNAEVVKSGAG